MYLNDSGTGCLYEFDVDQSSGEPHNRRTLVAFEQPGPAPDGLTIDDRGDIWVAMYDGWPVRHYSPEGNFLDAVELPVAQATSCAFGEAGRGTLFVTTGREQLDAKVLAASPMRVRCSGSPASARTGPAAISSRERFPHDPPGRTKTRWRQDDGRPNKTRSARNGRSSSRSAERSSPRLAEQSAAAPSPFPPIADFAFLSDCPHRRPRGTRRRNRLVVRAAVRLAKYLRVVAGSRGGLVSVGPLRDQRSQRPDL